MKLGAELELKDVEIRASTLEARKQFLNLVLKLKPEVSFDLLRVFNFDSLPEAYKEFQPQINFYAKFFLLHTKNSKCYSIDLSELGFKPDVRDTPLLTYFDFIHKNQSKFNQLIGKSENEWKKVTSYPDDELIISSALKKLIPNWKSLQSKKGSESLCSSLKKWAKKWNLDSNWCLDFALDCLRHCKVNLIDKIQFSDDYLTSEQLGSVYAFNSYRERHRGWIGAMLSSEFRSHVREYVIIGEIPDYPLFKYVWSEAVDNKTPKVFEITAGYYNPVTMFANNFRQEMEEKFWSEFFAFYSQRPHSFVGKNQQLRRQLKDFQHSLDNFILDVEKRLEPYADETISIKDINKHLRWLIEFQIPPNTKDYENLAKENNVDRKAIGYATKKISQLIGLKLRTAKRTGRPRGIKENKKRGNYAHW